jgi:Zn-dependent protease with chaperone function
MDFFAQQDAARRRTWLLIAYFLLAVILIIAAVFGAVVFVVQMTRDVQWPPLSSMDYFRILTAVAACTLAVIVGGSLYKMYELGGGGAAVAEMLGGTQIPPDTTEPKERVLLNVVEEMAIASGVSVPPVYVMEQEAGINAFAAGYTPNDAVISVTRGSLDLLNRAELQGVVAHEFSHILNGDMRLNLRLIGVLYGILLIALIGYGLVRRLHLVPTDSSDGHKGGGIGLIMAMLVLGMCLITIGLIGLFFGRLIKSAISRQREFLADAAAVQFTRYPAGIAGALRKIGGLSRGSRIWNDQAEAASHLFFGNATQDWFGGFMSTHPPLSERIRRLDPTFDGTFPKVRRANAEEAPGHARPASVPRDLAAVAAIAGQTGDIDAKKAATVMALVNSVDNGTSRRGRSIAMTPESAIASVGMLSPDRVFQAASLVASLPPNLVAAARQPAGAAATIFGLLLSRDPAVRQSQSKLLTPSNERGLCREAIPILKRLLPDLAQLPPEMRSPLVTIAAASLRAAPVDSCRTVCNLVHQLCVADGNLGVFEFVVQRVVLHQLRPVLEGPRPRKTVYFSIHSVLPACATLLSSLAYVGQSDPIAAARAFGLGARRLGSIGASKISLLPREATGAKALDEALDQLLVATLAVKRRIIEACAATIGADGLVTVEEMDLLRAVAMTLDCPMQSLSSGAA